MLTKADVRIAYSAGRAFNALEEDEIENEEMNNDSTDKSTWFTMEQTQLSVEKNNKSNLKPPKNDNDKIMDNNKKWYLNSNLKSKKQSNILKLQQMDKLGTSLSFFEICFDDASVTQIVGIIKLYGQRDKGDHKFDLSNQEFRLFLGILLP